MMKAKLALEKHTSPGFRTAKGDQKENVEDNTKTLQNTLTSSKGHILTKGKVKMIFERKARSNSPKENIPIKLNEIIHKQMSKHNSPGTNNSDGENSRNKELSVTKLQNMTLKRSPMNLKKSSKLISLQRTRNSPKFQSIKTEEYKKQIAKNNEELWEAAETGNLSKISQLLDPYFKVKKSSCLVDINSKGIENRTALHCAVYENRPEVIKALIKHGANLNACTIHRRTPLHIACILGQETICKLLLDAGADINVQDFEKNMPIHYASYHRI
jgi:hypothetical protein